MRAINQLLNISSTDPEDARRRKLLSILLLGVLTLTLLVLAVTVFATLSGTAGEPDEVARLYMALGAALAAIIITFSINRWWSGEIAGSIFLLFLTVIFAFSDDVQQVVEGRNLFLFTIPILMASVILRPWASFALAALNSIIIAILALDLPQYAPPNYAPPVTSMLGFFAVALVSWLSARNLENALEDLRAINRELDQRVEERTEELAEANQELAEANEQLKELDRLKSRFVSMVSHELRTPLNAIQGFTEMLEAGIYGELGPRQHKALKRVSVNAERLLGIVNDLLDQARIEAGQISFNITPFSPKELGEDLQAAIGILAESKGLELTTHIAPDMPKMLRGDAKRIHQVLVNLVNNSIKFTEQGGVYVRLYKYDPEHWAVDVTDTGPGIPEDAREYIFEPFRQVDSPGVREHKGTGLGLSIVSQLTQLMGGWLKLESELGVGSTFTVVLPLMPPQEEKEV